MAFTEYGPDALLDLEELELARRLRVEFAAAQLTSPHIVVEAGVPVLVWQD